MRNVLLMAAALRSAAAVAHRALPVERFSVAPMMDYTDRHFRHLFRLLSKESVLYTEMVTANTLVDDHGSPRHGSGDRWLAHDDAQEKTILQLGGSSPKVLGAATELAMAHHSYAGVNLNCGCPSDRVAGQGCFGAALMRDAGRVADCVDALGAASDAPVSVKCRVGVCDTVADMSDDDELLYEGLATFVDTVASRGVCDHFVVHARVAVLSGLSPDKNRKVPTLKPHLVERLAADFPNLQVVSNGEVDSYDAAILRSSGEVAGVMSGRDVCKRPWYYANVDSALFGAEADPARSRRDVLLGAYADYCDREELETTRPDYSPRRALVKPVLGLFHASPGAGLFKREIDALLKDPTLSVRAVLERAVAEVPDAVLDARPDNHVTNLERARAA